MITRLESYTNDVVQGALSPHTETPVQDSVSMGLRAQAAWDVMLGLCACAYLGLVLFDDVESPLLSLALIALVAHELFQILGVKTGMVSKSDFCVVYPEVCPLFSTCTLSIAARKGTPS